MSQDPKVITAMDQKSPVGSELPNEKTEDISISAGSTTALEADELNDKIKDAYSGSTQQHPFSSQIDAAYWKDVYEKAKYEGRHRFDPSIQWDSETEKKLVRKLDLRIMLWVWIMFSSLDLVRRNINRAISDNMLDDLNMNTNDFNNGQTIYLFSFLAAELPGGLLSKKVGPDTLTPIAICTWGLICACQSTIKSRAGFYLTRAFLGFSQGTFIPDMVLYMSYYWKSNELPIRLSVFWTAIPLTQIIGAFLAAGFLKMRGIQGWSGWQWLFLIEGLMSIIVGAMSFFLMPASITETHKIARGKATWLHGKTGWFTEREEKILVNRILRDDPSKGNMHNRQHIDVKGIWRAVKDYDLWPLYLLGLLAFIPFQPAANYLSLTLRNLGYTVFEANMLAIPGYALFFINADPRGHISQRKVSGKTPVLVSECLLGTSISHRIVGNISERQSMAHAILVGLASRNSNDVGTRAVSAAVYNICYQFGSIVAVNVYRDSDKPYYYRGNRILIGITCASIACFFAAKLYYIKRNQQKEKKWMALSQAERDEYLSTTTDTGANKLNVRFVH